MCGNVNNNSNRPVSVPQSVDQCAPTPANQDRSLAVQNQTQDSLSCNPKALEAQRRIDAKESAEKTFQNPSCDLSREQMVQALNGAGIGAKALSKASDAEIKTAFDQFSQAAQSPGHHEFKCKLGGQKFKTKMDVASDGAITNMDTHKVKKHHGGFFSKIGDAFKKVGGGLLDAGKGVLGGIADAGKGLLGGVLDAGKGLLSNIPVIGGLFGGAGGGGAGGGLLSGISGLLGGL